MTKKKGISKTKVAATGLLVGVAAGAAALALSDKKTRKKVKRTIEDVKDTTVEVLDDVERKTRTLRKDAKTKLEEIHKTSQKQL